MDSTRAAAVVAALTSAAGCATTIGPASIRTQRADYNAALQQTNDEQFLLNMVRLRYGETPSFLEITGIIVQLEIETAGNAGVDLGGPASTGVAVGGSRTRSEQPTVTYLPSQGDAFVRRFLMPLTSETLLLLWSSGWPFATVARLGIQRMNTEASTSIAPSPTQAGSAEAGFGALLDAMESLVREGKLRFEIEEAHAGSGRTSASGVVFRVVPGADRDPAVMRVLQRLQLAPGRDHYPVVPGTLHEDAGPPWTSLYVETRSLLGVLSLMAGAVDVPDEHRRADIVGTAADESSIVREMFRVRVSETRPETAYLAVPHRGHWFYIDDRDRQSKSTFVLLALTYALQAAPLATAGPSLVLPVGR